MPKLLTRRAFTAGLGAVGATPFILRSARAQSALEAAANKEGTLTWYTAQADTETAEIIGRAFTKLHPGVKVSVIRTTAQVALQRLNEDLRNSVAQCDVFSTTDMAHMPPLKARNALANYVPENAKGLAAAFKNVSDEGYFYPTNVTLALIIYNNQKVKPEDVPKNWIDLVDPKWAGKAAFGHPAFSGCTGNWVVCMRKLYGWEFFEKLAKNKPQIGRSGNDAITLLNSGERLVGLGPLASTLVGISRGNPLGVVYPADGTTMCISPSAVLANAPHPNAARLFMNFLVGPDYARVCVENHIDPVRDDVNPLPGAKHLNEINTLGLSTAELSKGIPEVIEQWRDTFGV